MKISENPSDYRTDRLRLRPLSISDADAFFEMFSDAATMEYWSNEPVGTREEAESLLRQDLEWSETPGVLCMGVALPETGRLIGKITLFAFSEQNRRAEVGYVLDRRYWNKGYMSEALQWLLAHAFETLKLHRLEADTDPDNIPSLALLEKLGFRREGLFRDRWWVHGKWHDSVMLGLLHEDYRRLQQANERDPR